jgi:hypothetical protein
MRSIGASCGKTGLGRRPNPIPTAERVLSAFARCIPVRPPAPSAGGEAPPEAAAGEVGSSSHHQRSVSPLEGRGGTTGAGPWIRPAMNLKAVAHAQRHRPAINAPQVAPEAAAVAEAVGHSSLALGGHHSPQRAPPWLAILFGTRQAPPSAAAPAFPTRRCYVL